MKVELGGGIRDLASIEGWLAAGVHRVILGTVAVRDPALVREACRRHPGRVAVGIDARDGFVAVDGWAEVSRMKALDLARAFEDAGVAAIIYTDISRDGAMAGPNVAATLALADAAHNQVLALMYRTVRDVYLGAGGILAAMRRGTVVFEHSTSEVGLAREIAEAASAGDALAREVWRGVGHALGLGVIDLVLLLNLDAVLIVGGVARAGALFLGEIENGTRTQCKLNALS